MKKKSKQSIKPKKKDNKFTLNWRFKDYLLNEGQEKQKQDEIISEDLKEFEEIKIQGIVYIDLESELLKSQIISHIRAIVGITRVDFVGESWYKKSFYISRLSIKIDLFKFQHVSLVNVLTFLKYEIERIPGVRQFQYITKAEVA